MTPPLDSAFQQALRLVGREVALKDAARSLELVPWRREDADRLFALASALREERLEILRGAGVLE